MPCTSPQQKSPGRPQPSLVQLIFSSLRSAHTPASPCARAPCAEGLGMSDHVHELLYTVAHAPRTRDCGPTSQHTSTTCASGVPVASQHACSGSDQLARCPARRVNWILNRRPPSLLAASPRSDLQLARRNDRVIASVRSFGEQPNERSGAAGRVFPARKKNMGAQSPMNS